MLSIFKVDLKLILGTILIIIVQSLSFWHNTEGLNKHLRSFLLVKLKINMVKLTQKQLPISIY